MNRLLILGKNGLLARYVNKYMSTYYTCEVIGSDALNAQSPDMKLLSDLVNRADHVINCMGVVKPYIEEYGVSATIKINAIFPEILSNMCERHDTGLIHISSDCVFDGGEGQYNENDNISTQDIYARTKGVTPTYGTTIRTSFIGENRRSKYPGLLSWVLSHKPGDHIDGYYNCLWNGITCLQLCKYMRQLLVCDQLWTGCRHVFSDRVVSKYELCNIINDVYDLNLIVNKTEALNIMGTEIHNTLDRSLSTVYTAPEFPCIERQISEQMQFDLR